MQLQSMLGDLVDYLIIGLDEWVPPGDIDTVGLIGEWLSIFG